VLLADDHPAMRAGIRAIVEKTPDIEVVGQAGEEAEAQRMAADLNPQVLLHDLRMPGPPPAETVAWVRAHCPETAVLASGPRLTSNESGVYAISSLLGFMGCLSLPIMPSRGSFSSCQ
jgi:DNA-binding NarL/FixJ family response regulator